MFRAGNPDLHEGTVGTTDLVGIVICMGIPCCIQIEPNILHWQHW